MPDIISINRLCPATNQVYRLPDAAPEEFAYSDGASVEQYLHQVLTESSDLSSRSPELQACVIDWPSEYHLSSDRSNLLRPFNLKSVHTVLELGSGCGAISRYLGEQGKQVDSVEGSAIRAGLGKLRCRDQDNVRVINANFNELAFPEEYYDLVLFVGVIEYARKFHPDAQSDREAAERILQQVRQYLKPGGVVLVAIENRLGLKYQLGAHEDHYAKRYVGINGYRESAGIATYSRNEWVELVQQAGFGGSSFSYPFPDYKIPRVVLGDRYLWDNPHVANHLEGLESRDYYAPLNRTPTESIGWQAAADGGYLAQIANSFCILMGDDYDALRQIQNFDFCHGPGSGRKNHYAVTTIKPAGEDVVYKLPTVAALEAADNGVTQVLEPQKFIPGDLLSTQWLRTILIHVRRDEFEARLREYYEFLGTVEAGDGLSIDLLPINILLTETDGWQVFDQEWQVDWPLTREYLLFRALLTFVVNNWVYLKDFLGWLELQNVRDFVEWGFHANMIHLSEHLPGFIEMENRFQRVIARDDSEPDVAALLNTVFDFSEGKEKIYSALYWRDAENGYQEAAKTVLEVTPNPELQTLSFALPAATNLHALRFDPFDIRRPEDAGFFTIRSIRLLSADDQDGPPLWSLESPEAVAECCQADSAVFDQMQDHGGWAAITDFPKLEFLLPEELTVPSDQPLQVEIEFAVLRTLEYALAYNRYLVSAAQIDKVETRTRRNLESMKLIGEYERGALQGEVTRQERQLDDMQNEIDHIKASKAFRIGSAIVKLATWLRHPRGTA